MSYKYKDRKIVCIVSDNLEIWQIMNVIGHLAVGLGSNKDGDLMGRDILKDASDIEHKGIARYGFIIKKGNPASIRRALEVSRQNMNITILDFPREMLDTSHDDELSDLISKKQEKDLEYLGAIFYGPSSDVNLLTKPFPLWS
jgi:hypothetical protein